MYKEFLFSAKNTTHSQHAALWNLGYILIWYLHLKLVISQQAHSSDLTAVISLPTVKTERFKLKSLHS